jgi:2'-5' RNA ligase
MNSIACNIVLIPNNKIAESAYRISSQLEKYGTLFTLKEGEYFPHLSLYMLQLKDSNVAKVCEVLASIAKTPHSINLVADAYRQGERYIGASFSRTTALDTLQMTIVNSINTFSNGMPEKDKKHLETAKGKALEYLELYGYRDIGEFFHPHITLTRFKSDEEPNLEFLPSASKFDTTFTKLAIFERGDHYTCVRKIAEFELTG